MHDAVCYSYPNNPHLMGLYVLLLLFMCYYYYSCVVIIIHDVERDAFYNCAFLTTLNSIRILTAPYPWRWMWFIHPTFRTHIDDIYESPSQCVLLLTLSVYRCLPVVASLSLNAAVSVTVNFSPTFIDVVAPQLMSRVVSAGADIAPPTKELGKRC